MSINTSLPCFIAMDKFELKQALHYHDLLAEADKVCLTSTIVSIPLNALCIYVLWKSRKQIKSNGAQRLTANAHLSEGAIHLIHLGQFD